MISSGGMEYDCIISGGVETVASGVMMAGDPIYGGGSEIVQSGAVLQGSEFIGDGTMTVVGGGSAGVVTLESGTLEVASGGAVGGVDFWNNGAGIDTLVLDASKSFHGTVAGFGTGDQIDLQDVAFVPTTKKGPVSYSNSGGSGTLTVTDGVNTAAIQLLGAYIASDFVAASDGHAAPSSPSRRRPRPETTAMATRSHLWLPLDGTPEEIRPLWRRAARASRYDVTT